VAFSALVLMEGGHPHTISFALPYPSQRSPVLGRQAVAASHGLAAQTGLGVLQRGGNAVDAAVAAAAVQTVVEPTMNGVGGDLFAMVWDGQRLDGLNASGRAPRGWSPGRFAGKKQMPALGWDAVTVPGAVSGWVALWRKHGSQPFASLLAPAIDYAREGFPVSPKVAALWAEVPGRFAGFAELARVFLPGGRAPLAGEWFRLPDLASTLESVAASEGASFYEGELAERIAAASAAEGGALDAQDLRRHRAEWVEPLGVDYRGVRLHELPPNGQGLASLIALGILAELDSPGPDHPDSLHFQIEAMKIAFAECRRHLGDGTTVRAPDLLDRARLRRYAARLRRDRAATPRPLPPPDHGTVYVTAADRQGRMVSLIQSNYLGFGSGVVVPGTGITMQNRGLGFSLDPRRPNFVAGGARPYHTIMPGFVTSGGWPVMSFGLMGGHMQPQGHVQLMARIFGHGQNPQAACDAPRWHVTPRSEVAIEPGFAPSVLRSLRRRGHRLIQNAPTLLFGGAQVIYKLPGGYCAASDPRKDGQAVAS
jgi:gamma-glutamyltranspeptidase/glutathione hydrolase